MSLVRDWEAGGRFHGIFGHRVFAVERAGAPNQVPLVILHGFPTSSYDFGAALPELAPRRRVVVHDHLGFGLSDKPERWSYSLVEQAEVAIALWRSLGITKAHVIAHDYGTSVATELVARRDRGLLPIEIASLTLCNGSVHLDLARLTLAQRLLRSPSVGPAFARLATKRVFDAQMRRIVGDPASLSTEDLDAMWAGLVRANGRARMHHLSSYLDERVRFRDRWIEPLTRIDVPAHVLWGRRDPIAVPAIAERLAAQMPGARLTWLDELGHYPMVEAPARFAAAANAFLEPLP